MLTIAYVLSALQLLAAASPSPPRSDIQRVTLNRRQSHNVTAVVDLDKVQTRVGNVLEKYLVGFTAFLDNLGEAHPLAPVLNSTTKRAVGSTPLDDDDGALWLGLLQAGTPAQPFTVGFDTGSASLLLVSSACTSADCQAHATYNAAASSSSVNRNEPFRLRVTNKDIVSGSQYTDTVSVAGLSANAQIFGASSTYPPSFNSYCITPDGRVGMAFQSISAYDAPSYPQTLVAQSATTDPVFAFRLGTTNSELTLGGVNPAAFVGTITYTPVTFKGFWQVNMDSVFLNGRRIISRYPAIIDTGSPYIIGDRGNVERFYDAVPKSNPLRNGMYTIPCDAIPDVRLTFGGASYPIDPALFNLGPVSAGSNQCVGALIAGTPPQRFWSVGDAFLQNVYSVFDLGANRVGFAILR